MNQQWLVKHVLESLDSTPDDPNPGLGRYLSFDEALQIVDETLDFVGRQNDDVEYAYLSGHRKRLAHSLSRIPKARTDNASCLDVGCYGYMGFWAEKFLGYTNVQGVEWRPDSDEKVITRTISRDDESVELKCHNFDISQPDWPLDEQFDVVLFFEVLEHINRDPMGVMANINKRMKPDGTLVMSVPNAISYKTVRELLVGMPPWTYWFFEPDLSHEPRHCFEYTPIIFKLLLRASGFDERSFKTIYAYTDPADQADMLEIAEALSIDCERFGETMIAQASKVSDEIPVRYPDVLYSPDRYYQRAYPVLSPRLDKAVEHFREMRCDGDQEVLRQYESLQSAWEISQARLKATEEQYESCKRELNEVQAHAATLEKERGELRAQIDELLFACDCYLQNDQSASQLQQELRRKETEIDQLSSRLDQLESEARDLRTEARRASELQQQLEHALSRSDELSQQNECLKSQLNDLLFTCDGHMSEAEKAKGRADSAERNLEDAQSRIEELTRVEADLTAQVNQLLFTCDCYLQNEADSRQAAEAAEACTRQVRSELAATAQQLEESTRARADLEARVNQLLFMCDCYLQNEKEGREAAARSDQRVAELDAELQRSVRQVAELSRQNSDLRAQVNELLFTCDCYLQRVNDVTHCSQVVREARFRRVLDRAKSVARKIPVLRAILRPMYDRLKRVVKRSGLSPVQP